LAINQETIDQAALYTDEQVRAHTDAADPHPNYAELVYTDSNPTGGAFIILRTTDTALPPVQPGSVVMAPGPTPAAGVYMLNEASTAWVLLGTGPIPTDTTPPTVPGNLRISGAPTTSSITVVWNASTDTETGLAGYEVSVDSGAFVSLPNTTLSYSAINLQPSTTHTIRVRAKDRATTANVSASASITATTAALSVTAPRNLRVTNTATTSLTFAWDGPSNGTVASYETRLSGGTFTSNGTALTRTVTGLIQGTLYTFGVRAIDINGTASAETTLAASTSSSNPSAVVTLLGASTSAGSTHGNYGNNWPVWRAYNLSSLNSNAAKTPKPLAIAYSESGPNLGGATPDYTTIFNHCRSTLDTFYYGGTGQTQNANRTIKFYWSNGNENYNKGIFASTLTTYPQATLDAYTASMKALYDACHYIDPVTGARRYPNAFAGSNPTQYQEFKGWASPGLMASARYHDFVMWSNYSDTGTPADGTAIQYVWPYTGPRNPTQAQLDDTRGWLMRCVNRTKLMEDKARSERGDTVRIAYSVGELGVNRSPSDPTLRPYYAVHAFYGGLRSLCNLFDLDFAFACWWDGGTNALFSFDDNMTQGPTTAEAWHDAPQYNHIFGGTHPPEWVGNPKASWNTNGPVV
jgi:hypothetical protein